MTGCTGEGEKLPPSSAITSSHPNPTAAPPPQTPSDVHQRGDLRQEHVSSWSHYEAVSSHSVRVFFYMGDPTCHGVRATVNENATTVRIGLLEGALPDAPSECAAMAMSASLLVTTHDPIGTRSIIPAS